MIRTKWLTALCATVCMATAISGMTPGVAATLRYGGTTPPLTMDPHVTNDFVTTALVRQIYDTIVDLQDDMQIGPGIATAWTYQGNNTWRFKIREGVKFQDGTPLSVDDIIFSIMRQKGSPLYTALFGGIKEAVKVDDTSVDVISNGPDPILPRKMVRLFVMSQAWAKANNVEKLPDLGAQGTEAYSLRHANGTGPMQLVSQDPGRKTVFARNANYWGPFPGNVTEAIYTPIGSSPTRVAALLSGELDLITDLPIQDIERVKSTPGFHIEQVPQQLSMFLEMDGTRDVALDVFDKSGKPLQANPLKDVRVRKALSLAIDSKLIVQRVMRGQAVPLSVGGAYGMDGFQKDLDTGRPYDVEQAKKLLAEAGYPDGFAIQLNCPLERYTNADEICRAVASMLARVGVEVRVKGMVWPEFARMLVNGPSSSFHLIGGSGNSGDLQDTFVSIMATRDKAKGRGGTNWAMWTNPEFDAVVDELVTTFDPAKRTELYRKGLTIARDQVQGIYLFQPVLSWGMKDSVSASARADAAVMLQKVQIKP
ncbi:ABC transporter substrate-binding protein [Chelatococcus asaccharovorans]|uniref:ABC transporter substrate-binding protein n=1 Tax=Chelatococcus asaccharovorans TaxID=28210 RepID=UPI00224C75DE|nr:ABC transporter substrate-binding protein [Chelatococcus asaccharovorans]CAH1653466.1 Peptide/nickel transport system substrate-binding protein [Chelatococcus asaccharovorans]CAH1694138.1 Peptide/nickel transport system substrate-binding protein [Chelatococcus asaccharovorans]